jgi:hypothetical protein
MTIDPDMLRRLREALDAADGQDAAEALPHLRDAAERLAALIDDALAEAVVDGGSSIRSAGARAGLSENAVGPRLARTRRLAAYADDKGRVTASGVERARYDAETGAAPPAAAAPPPPMRFKPRRPTT